MFKKIAIGVAVVIAAILAFAATKPDTFSVQRTVTVKAKPEKVFAQINDFHNWGAWDPWAKMDPSMKVTYSGAASGKGSVYAWEGNGHVGSGTMEITDSMPSSKVTIKLDFMKPMEGHNTSEFTMIPKGDSTDVTWAMSGPVPFMHKIMHVFFNMDKMVGGQFEKGLNDLKAISEK